MNIADMTRCIDMANNCLFYLKDFYKSQSSFYEHADDIFSKHDSSAHKTSPSNSNSESEFNSIVSPSKSLNNTLRLTPESRWQLKNGLIKPNISSLNNLDATTIGEYENRFLVYLFQLFASYLNKKVIFEFVFNCFCQQSKVFFFSLKTISNRPIIELT